MGFDEVFAKFHKLIYQIGYRMIKDVGLAEDIMQETFLKAYKKMDSIEDQNKLGAWLSSIATRTAIDFIRKEKRLKETMVDDTDITIIKQGNQESGIVENEVELLFMKENIHEKILLLPDCQKEVFLLRIQFGLKEHEIAEKLHLKPATVKTRMYRARKQLKLMMNCRESA
ncbi:RNA polymerase sigma factor [Falsibacillus albus]|uniref:RNA polymerase sigma factor n=2 Tax=Falsibacillus albus TaxID=2478915 RepID=A0A3L7JTI6_9BACI|nr:RNA polymerase sigma factor [Falsibacillus albus]